MPDWTKEQNEAINKEGKNIIVSAGAGSGKTAVLTERVIRKLKQGVQIDKLLVLTFTNAAAKEMKERITNEIIDNPKLHEQLNLIDGAYITTFDSFSLSLVKKYHYLLGLNHDINIADSTIIYSKKNEIIDEIFDSFYDSSDLDFKKLIYDFCVKDDKEIKKSILSINNKLDLLYEKDSFLDNYLDNYYDEKNIDSKIKEFENSLTDRVSKIADLINDLSYYVDSKYINKLNDLLLPIINCKSYMELKPLLDLRLPVLPKNSEEASKGIKESISNIIKELKKICIYSDEQELKSGVLSTYSYVKIIIKIIKELDLRIYKFKKENNIFEFNDISKMAIKILDKNKKICDEIKYSLNEIMVDEYQDTSDLQEKFISLIENNNVYMVGDIKQSIYRFRNANPYIFKNKYDSYSNNLTGYKIDLNKNFRSREETLNDINIIFNIIMDNLLGGADYKKSHQMIFGNDRYTKMKMKNQNNNLEIYNYKYDSDSIFRKEEIEAFITAQDIKEKIESKYQVFDKKTSSLRDVKYDDFVILMDRASKFDLYKKIFEFLNIPLTKYTDTSITDSEEIVLVKNILGLILKYKRKEIDIEFKYLVTSLSRSYLFRYDDNTIYKMLESTLIKNDIVYSIIDLVNNYDSYSIPLIISDIIDKFDFYEALIKKGDITSGIIRLEYIFNLAKNCEKTNYSIEDFYNYLKKLIEDNIDINVQFSTTNNNSVKIMTIHKSKGLEYPICYYTGLYNKFNISEVKDRFIFDKELGIITPYFEEGIKKTFYNYLFKENYLKEEISEKIRLFYVALTRCKEKIILLGPLENKTMNNLEERYSYKSFLDMLNSVYDNISEFITDVDLSKYNLTKEYNLVKKINYKSQIKKDLSKINDIELDINNDIIESYKYSKDTKELLNSSQRSKLIYGEYIHYVFEITDFKNPNYSNLTENEKKLVSKFLNCGLNFSNSDIYKEVHFVYNDKGRDNEGIIDLILEDKNSVKIIDYKLKDISDIEYLKQLEGYKDYIMTKTNKKISIYLYSIINGELKELKG